MAQSLMDERGEEVAAVEVSFQCGASGRDATRDPHSSFCKAGLEPTNDKSTYPFVRYTLSCRFAR
jgi:hypothetical protein